MAIVVADDASTAEGQASGELGGAVARSIPPLSTYCEDEHVLWDWLKAHLNLHVPRRAFCDCHSAPFEYVKAAYLESASAPARDLVVWGPRGGGKTRLAAAVTLMELLHKPGIAVRVLAGSMDQALKVWEHLLPDLEQHAEEELEGSRSRSRRVNLSNGSSAAILAQSQCAVRGQRVQKMRCDEVEMFDKDVWAAVGPTTKSKTVQVRNAATGQVESRTYTGVVEALSTYHEVGGRMQEIIEKLEGGQEPVEEPSSGSVAPGPALSVLAAPGLAALGRAASHDQEGSCDLAAGETRETALKPPDLGPRLIRWCILDVMARCEPQRVCAGCGLWKECGGRAKEVWEDTGLPKADGFMSVADVLRTKRRLSEEKWQTEMLCQRPTKDGRVFPSFTVATHVRAFDPVGLGLELSLGVDFGYANPFVALWIGKDAGGTVYVADEHVLKETIVEVHIEHIWARDRLRGWGPVKRVYCDPAGRNRSEQTGESSVTVLRKADFGVKFRNSLIQEGIELVRLLCRSADGRSRLVVHPRCRGLIKALESYRYPKDGTNELPKKDGEHDHPIDALRYWVLNNLVSHEAEHRVS